MLDTLTANSDRTATIGLLLGALATIVSLVFPGGPVIGAIAILLCVRSVRATPPTAKRWRAVTGIALGGVSFLIVAGWAANGFK